MTLLHIYKSTVVGAGGRRHTGQCPCMCRGTVVGPGDIKWSEYTGIVHLHVQKHCGQTKGYSDGQRTQERCSCMYRSTVVGAGDNEWSQHTEMVLLNMQRHCDWTMAH